MPWTRVAQAWPHSRGGIKSRSAVVCLCVGSIFFQHHSESQLYKADTLSFQYFDLLFGCMWASCIIVRPHLGGGIRCTGDATMNGPPCLTIVGCLVCIGPRSETHDARHSWHHLFPLLSPLSPTAKITLRAVESCCELMMVCGGAVDRNHILYHRILYNSG